MFRLNSVLRDPNEQEASSGGSQLAEPSSFQEAIERGFDEQEAAENVKVENNESSDTSENKEEVNKKPDTSAQNDDPEFEMDFEEEIGKGKSKYKLSEMKNDIKWLFDNRESIAVSLKIKEIAMKNPEFGKLLQTVTKQSFNEKGEFNSEYASRTLKQLEEKQEIIQESIDDKTDDIAEMEKDLNELDPESPQARILKRNINALKATKSQLKAALDQNKQFQSKLEGLDKFKNDFSMEKENKLRDDEFKRVSSVFDAEFGSLTDASKQGGYKFINDKIKTRFTKDVKQGIASRAENIRSDEDFVKALREVASAVYKDYQMEGEAHVNDYIRKKNGGKQFEKQAVSPEKKEEKEDTRSMGEMIADAVFAEE